MIVATTTITTTTTTTNRHHHFLLFLSFLFLMSSSFVTKAMSMSTTAVVASKPRTKQKQHKVAIIGAGAAGLVSARILSKQSNHQDNIDLTVFESRDDIGGVWKYEKDSTTKPMYRGLRTNLPKEVMAFREKPFTDAPQDKSFVTHTDVANYLQSYKNQYNLQKYIKYSTNVKQLTILKDTISSFSPPPPSKTKKTGEGEKGDEEESEEIWPKIKLDYDYDDESKSESVSEIFDAIFICNGHYAIPSSPDIPGLLQYYNKGQTTNIMHSVSYDDPSIFIGQTVLCIGGRASGSDLAREISSFANHVYLSDTTCELNPITGQPKQQSNKVTWLPKTIQVEESGIMKFDNIDYTLDITKIDTIIFCSGYDYDFPFINDKSNLNLDQIRGERRIKPLYKQLWHAEYPNICFVGIPHSVVPFPLFEFQAEAVLKQLIEYDSLPNLKNRLDEAKKDSISGGAKGPQVGRVQDTHYLGSAQWDYCRMMAKLAGIYDEKIENFISTNEDIYNHAGHARGSSFPGGPDSYREIVYKRDYDTSDWSVVKEQPQHQEQQPAEAL